MDPSALELAEALGAAQSRDEVSDALVQLRDLAYDRPDAWQGLSAEVLFQFLMERVDSAEDDALDWASVGSVLGDALSGITGWLSARGA